MVDALSVLFVERYHSNKCNRKLCRSNLTIDIRISLSSFANASFIFSLRIMHNVYSCKADCQEGKF